MTSPFAFDRIQDRFCQCNEHAWPYLDAGRQEKTTATAAIGENRMTTETTVSPHVPQRPVGRSLADFGDLLPSEKLLLEKCRLGESVVISNDRPEEQTDENTIRAGFLRFLVLGGDEHCAIHESGIHLRGAWISGTLDIENTIAHTSIICIHCMFDSSLMLRRSRIPGGVFLSGSKVAGIQGDGLISGGDVYLRQQFESTAPIRLIGAKIAGDFACDGALLHGETADSGTEHAANTPALDLDRAEIDGSIFMHDGLESIGSISVAGAKINGTLSLEKAKIKRNDEFSICLDRSLIKGTAFLRNEFHSEGSLRLVGTRIVGNLELSGSLIDGLGEASIIADGAIVDGDVLMKNGFRAIGTVRLIGSRIEGDLSISEAELNGGLEPSIIAESMIVTGRFFLRNIEKKLEKISLADAKIGIVVDDPDCWGSNLVLSGFIYERFGGEATTSAKSRLGWLDKQPPINSGLQGYDSDFRPQPWRHLQKVLREMGHTEDARQVAIAFEHRSRAAGLIGQSPARLRNWPAWSNPPRRWAYRHLACFLHWCFWLFTGYGYRPMRLLAWFFFIWLGCAMFYWHVALPPRDVFAPSSPLVFQNPAYKVCEPGSEEAKVELTKPADAQPPPVQGAGNWYLCETLPQEYTGFSPLAYSLDVILPLVDLQQEHDWAPRIPTPKASRWDEWRGSGWKHVTRMVIWGEILFGWVASLLLVAIVSGLTKRRED